MRVVLVAATLLAATTGLATAQSHQHGEDMKHGDKSTAVVPVEPGNGAFAAIAEIVRLLRDDPATDWSRVNLDALRNHLIDMDNLIKASSVVQEAVEDGLRIRIPRSLPGNDAAARMVPAHAPVLAGETGWASTLATEGNTLVWTVRSPDGDAATIRALGFFGLMATGAHHEAHHLGIARGEMVH